MAYRVAQLRKSNATTYMETINATASTYASPNKFAEVGSGATFTDFALNGTFNAGQVYYLRFLIHRVPHGFYSQSMKNHGGSFINADNMDFTLLLIGTDQNNSDEEISEVIDSFTVDSLAASETNIGRNTIYYARTLVFSPNHNSTQLVFRMTRVAYDALVQPRTWLTDASSNEERVIYSSQGNQTGIVSTSGARIIYSQDQQQSGDLCQLYNIMPNKEWIKFGYQCRPGALIVVNNEPIVVGRSGIYEINNGTKITSFMIASPGGSDPNNIDAFLLDYAYNDEEE